MEKNGRVLDLFKGNKEWGLNEVSTSIAHALDIYAKDKSADFLYREVLTSFETMFNLVAPNRSIRSENSDTPGIATQETTTADAFFEQALQFARTESVQWRTLYQRKPETTQIPFLDFFTQKANGAETAAPDKSLLYRIVSVDAAHVTASAT